MPWFSYQLKNKRLSHNKHLLNSSMPRDVLGSQETKWFCPKKLMIKKVVIDIHFVRCHDAIMVTFTESPLRDSSWIFIGEISECLGFSLKCFRRALLAVQWLEFALQCRGHWFDPWPGTIPHAIEQLSPCATIAEAAHLEPVLWNKRSHRKEKPDHHRKNSPHSPQLEKAHTLQWRPSTAQNN